MGQEKCVHIDFEPGSADVRALAKRNKTSIETAAREARYSFFAGVAKRRRCHTIFLAHHADDLVETFLINLFRGAGATGLAAMREVSARRIEEVDLTIVRPLLSIWRDEIDNYVRERRSNSAKTHPTKISLRCATEFAAASFLIWRKRSTVAFGRISGEPPSSSPKKRTGSKANCQTQTVPIFRLESCARCLSRSIAERF